MRAAIETFTSPGDLVLDPHVGGGTTLVEALVEIYAASLNRPSRLDADDVAMSALCR